jgi:hypothetical protein
MRTSWTTAVVSCLLALEGAYFLYSASVLAALYRGASNVSQDAPLPAFVWQYGVLACVFGALGILYWLGRWHVRLWFRALAAALGVYGIYAALSGYRSVLSWSGLWHGDLVALGVASSVGFILIGAFALLPGTPLPHSGQ